LLGYKRAGICMDGGCHSGRSPFWIKRKREAPWPFWPAQSCATPVPILPDKFCLPGKLSHAFPYLSIG